MTSHDVVAKIRRGLKQKKVGHAGTLDPMATGVLIVCLGAATRLSEYVMQSVKQYRARVHLGVTTDTYDAEGEVQQVRDAGHIRKEDIEAALKLFVGNIQQVPPMYSAIKQQGKKLYDLARAGQVVEREARSVTVESIVITDWQPPYLTVEVTCSAGTYIRSLAYDLGEALGVGAHLSGLVRLASGAFRLEAAVELGTVVEAADWQRYVISPQAALVGWPRVELDDNAAEHIRHGRGVPIQAMDDAQEMCMAFRPDGQLLAVLHADSGLWKPHKVFSSSE